MTYHDFGGRGGPHVLLAHANGFPPTAYRRFATPLLDRFRVWGMYQRPFWPAARSEDLRDWHVLGDDVVRLIEAHGLDGIVGIGHSLGGVAMMYAAIQRPDLIQALVLIEPVFLPPALLEAIRRAPVTAVDRLPLCRIAMNRRWRWPGPAAAFHHWRSKAVFSRVPDDVLWDHVFGALREAGDGSGTVELACPPEWESRIHATAPTDVWACIPRITQPTLGIRGALTDTIAPEEWNRWQRLQPAATFRDLPDVGHLLPLEAPEAVAAVVSDWLADIHGEQVHGAVLR